MSNSILNTMKAVEEVPDGPISGQPLPETIVNQANLDARDALSLRNFINKFMPTGFKVIVNLNYIPDVNHALFMIAHTPFYPPMCPLNVDAWIAIKNAFRPVAFDPALGTLPDWQIGVGDIPAGISIVQYQEPNILSLLAANHRFWMGSLNYHIRVVANFFTTGYIFFTKLRNLPRAWGKYNQYKYAPLWYKKDNTFQAGQQNSYGRTDLSMFRHMSITSPFEKQVPVDMDVLLNERFRATVLNEDSNVTMTQNDDVVAVYAGSPLTSIGEGGQLEFIIENCAGPDFQLFTPRPLVTNTFQPTGRVLGFDGKPTQYATKRYPNIVLPDVMPNPSIISDGVFKLSKASDPPEPSVGFST